MQKEPLFLVIGKVQEGKKRGRVLGFPTANLACPPAVPPGIYAGEAAWQNKVFPAALYKEKDRDVIEAHLLDFQGELYGELVTLAAYKKLREPANFANDEELISAIKKDIEEIRKCLSSHLLRCEDKQE
ncbi:MAG: riboflavin kinase [Candidatus Liptonbacteria bacterium]|nr:riboflavin kinase [Candidatus Liptonbacteria bacterium]